MQSNNPVFARAEGFNGRGGGSAYPRGGDYAAYGSPSTWSVGTPGAASQAPADPYGGRGVPGQVDQGRMTIDSVVQRTGMTLGVLLITAAATWVLTGDVSASAQGTSAIATLGALSGIGALVGFGLAMVNSFKRVVSPGLVLAYAAVEGVFVGAFSKLVESMFAPEDNIVVMAVLGTVGAFAGTLAAYKFFDIRVGEKFRTFVIAAMFGFVALSLLDMVLGFFSADFGFNGFGGVGLVASVIGLGLGVLMLILDFDFVERGVAAGLPERESWRAAFGLTVTLIWIYIEMLRILAILRQD